MNNGAATNVFDVNHVSPMHIAAARGNVDVGILLADGDAKMDSKDKVIRPKLFLSQMLFYKNVLII